MDDGSGAKAVATACPACGSTAAQTHPARPYDLPLIRCHVCGLVYAWPPPTTTDIAAAYPASYYAHQPPRPSGGRARLLRDLTLHRYFGYPLSGTAAALPAQARAPLLLALALLKARWRTTPPAVANGRLLDVGCGSGGYLAYTRDLGWTVAGLEPDATASDYAVQTMGLDVRCGTLATADWPNDSFDVITFWHSLEHMVEPLAALERAYSLVRPGGLIMLEMPNWLSVQRMLFGRQWFHLDLPRHLVHFSAPALRHCLASAGFSDIELASVPSTVGVTGSLERIVMHSTGPAGPARWRHNRLLKAAVWPAEALAAAAGRGGCITATGRKP